METLTGRATEVALLGDLLDQALGGRASIALILAEAGGGKTALLDAFTEHARNRATVAWGDALPGDDVRELWPWITILRALTKSTAAAEPAAALEALSSVTDEASRFRAFDLAAQALGAAGPLVLVLDDLHWADGSSLKLLEFVAASLRHAPILFVLATRPEVSDDVSATIATLVRRGASRIELQPFGPADVRTYLEQHAVEPALAPRVFAATAGNPLFVREFARHLATGRPAEGVPASLAELARGDAARLSLPARALLETCACFDGDIALEVAVPAADATGDAIEELVRANFLVRRATGPAFRHELLREAVRSALPPPRIAAIDARIASAAAALGQTRLVALHGCRAGSQWDPRQAYAAAADISRQAAAVSAVEEATRFAGLAKMVWPYIDISDAERLDILVIEGESLTRGGHAGRGREVFREARRLATNLGDADTLGRIALTFGLGHEHGRAHDAEVVALLWQALDVAPADAHAMRAMLLSRLAWQELDYGTVSRRRAFAEDALREARMAEEPAALASALNALCWALADPGDLPARLDAASAAVMAARDAGDIDLELGGLLWLYRAELEAGRIARARAAAAQFDALTSRYPLPYHRWYAHLMRGALALLGGDREEARAWANEIDPEATTQPEMAVVNRAALLSEVAFAGTVDEALEGAVMVEAMLQETMGIGWIARPLRVVFAEGPAAGRKALAEAMSQFATVSTDEDWYATTSTFAAAAVLAGAKDHAARLYELLLPYADRWVVMGNGAACRGPVSSFLAALAAVLGDEVAGARHYAAATAALEANEGHGAAHWMDVRPAAGRAPSPKASPLSAREAEVLALVARGHSNQEIADALVLSVRTVQRHIENAYTRLGVHNRAGATLAAVELGLVAPGDTRPAVG